MMQIRKVEKDFSGLNNWRKETQKKTALHAEHKLDLYRESIPGQSTLVLFLNGLQRTFVLLCTKHIKKIFFLFQRNALSFKKK